MRITGWAALGATAAIMLTACAQPGGESGSAPDRALSWDDLAGRTFVSTDVTQDGQPYPLVKGSVVRLTFDDGQIGAHAGCNTMGGGAGIDSGRLVITGNGLAMTEMACQPKLMDQDTWLSGVLVDHPTVTLTGDQLQLATTRYTLRLVDDKTVNPDQLLEGTKWSITGLVTGSGPDGSVASMPAGVKASLLLANGRFQATACNRMHGSYVIDGDTLTVSDLAMTQMACPGPRGAVEAHLLKVLDGPMTVTVDGRTLTLTNGAVGIQLAAE